MRTVLFVCSGNTCRSPMAEAIARRWLQSEAPQPLKDLFVASGGTTAMDGMPTSPGTLVALRAMGIDHDGRSKAISPEMVRKAELVLCMTHEHMHAVQSMMSSDKDQTAKIVMLDPESDMEDPIGLGQGAYDALARTLVTCIPNRLKELLAHENRSGIRSSR